MKKKYFTKKAFLSLIIFSLLWIHQPIGEKGFTLAYGASKSGNKKYNYYRIKKGDTLGKIARKYGLKISTLARINNISIKSTLRIGIRLKTVRKTTSGKKIHAKKLSRKNTRIKKSSKKKNHKKNIRHTCFRSYKVKKGDTLSRIAHKFRTKTKRLARINKMKLSSPLRIGKRLKIPTRGNKFCKCRKKNRLQNIEKSDWITSESNIKILLPHNYKLSNIEKIIFSEKEYTIKLFARNFLQGNAVYMEILPTKDKPFPISTNFVVEYNGNRIILDKKEWGYQSIFPISADEEPGDHPLIVDSSIKMFNTRRTFTVNIKGQQFSTEIWKRYLGNYDRRWKPSIKQKQRWKMIFSKRQTWIEQCKEKKEQVFSLITGNKMSRAFAHPRAYHYVTSLFFTNRKFVRYYRKGGKIHYAKPHEARHRGLDLAGRIGTPIYAMARGKVVLAQPMYYEGKFTVIDHGNNIFTGYMHQNKIFVKEGDIVKAGQQIGTVGATGKVTGPHLHISLWISGKPVHPLSLLPLPIRE